MMVSLSAGLVFSAGAQNIVTFTNPVTVSQQFGTSLAVPRPDWILIGDSANDDGKGSVFLFSTNGTFIRTFHNPTPAQGLAMGQNMALVGSNHFVTGAPGGAGPVGTEPGAAHLFHLDGSLVKSFSDPAPQERRLFGSSVAGVGSDRVVISATEFNRMGPGVVYIFGTNGTLQTTITNPAPRPYGAFGSPLRVIGTDRLFIGSGDEIVYQYDTGGTLVRSFTPPAEAISFGFAIAPLGTDRLVIGAPGRNSATSQGAGAIYIYEADGRFVRMIPGGGQFASFGHAVVALGNRLIIGAPGLQGATMFELCGNPIKGFVLPASDRISIEMIGERDVLIGVTSIQGGYAVLFFGGGDRILSPMVESDFASGLDGWSSGPMGATYDAGSGAVFVREESNDGATNYWKAPAKFLGNKSSAYHGKLQFEQKTSELSGANATGEVALRGSGLTLVRSVAAPNANFSIFEVPLSAEGWRVEGGRGGVAATEAQFLVALSGLTAVEIRAEFSATKPEINTLDNVRLLQPQAVCDTVLRTEREAESVRVEWAANALNFNLYWSTNLNGSNWTAVTSIRKETNGVTSVLESNGGGAAFYRLSRP